MTKVLTLKQPWASLVLSGIKKIENRTWSTRYRGRLFIHAGATVDRVSASDLPPGMTMQAVASLPRSAILGSVELVDCKEDTDLLPGDEFADDPFLVGPWCWLLRDPQPLRQPLVCSGKLGLWSPTVELLKRLDAAAMEAIAK